MNRRVGTLLTFVAGSTQGAMLLTLGVPFWVTVLASALLGMLIGVLEETRPWRPRWVVCVDMTPDRPCNNKILREEGRYLTRLGADVRAAELTNPPSGQAYASNLVIVERLP